MGMIIFIDALNKSSNHAKFFAVKKFIDELIQIHNTQAVLRKITIYFLNSM